MIAHLIGRIAAALTRWAHHRRVHVYLSTSCLHDDHRYCQAKTGKSGAKVPGACKFCPAACVCRCHWETT